MKKDILEYIEIIGAITLTDIEMSNSVDAEDGLGYLNKILDKSIGTPLEDDVKTIIKHQVKLMVSKTNEHYILWNQLTNLNNRTE